MTASLSIKSNYCFIMYPTAGRSCLTECNTSSKFCGPFHKIRKISRTNFVQEIVRVFHRPVLVLWTLDFRYTFFYYETGWEPLSRRRHPKKLTTMYTIRNNLKIVPD